MSFLRRQRRALRVPPMFAFAKGRGGMGTIRKCLENGIRWLDRGRDSGHSLYQEDRDMIKVEWIYRRDDFDVNLFRAAQLQVCATQLELLLAPAVPLTGECQGDIPPEIILSIYPQVVMVALDILYPEAYRAAERGEEDYRHLLARIRTPKMVHSRDSTDKHNVNYWPQPDRQATREDLVHFYLLVMAWYVDLKSRLQARCVSAEALHGMTEAVGSLLDITMAAPETIEDFRNELIRHWLRLDLPPQQGRAK